MRPPAVAAATRPADASSADRGGVRPAALLAASKSAAPDPRGVSAANAVLRARVWLSRAVEPGSAALYRYIAEVGPVEAVRQIRAGAVPPGVSQAAAGRRHLDQVDADLARAERHGLRVLIPEDEEWPEYALLRMEAATARGLP